MMLAALVDTAMDLAVVPGYTKVGYHTRRALGWGEMPPGSMTGRRALVTGATSGLGLATAQALAGLGASVHVLARDRERGERAVARIEQESGGGERGGGRGHGGDLGLGGRRSLGGGRREVHLELADLSSIDSVRSFARRFSAEGDALHVLVNNAGLLDEKRELSADGHELAFATNVLGMFLLTNELLPLLCAGAPSRIVNVSSGGMYTRRIDVSDLESERGDYDGPGVYARTKRAQVILTELWAERLAQTGVVVHAMHPGWADTPGIARSLPRFHRALRPLLRTPAEGADTIVWLASAEEPGRSSGGFWHDRRARATHRVPWTRETDADRRALWQACMRATGPNSPQAEAILARAGEPR
jgi:dehydrogenase/reductase SDR family protein 12